MLGLANSISSKPYQRQNYRVQLKEYLRVYDSNSFELLGYVLDISQYGVQLVSREPIEDSPSFDFCVELPFQIEGQSQLYLSAKMIWRKIDVIPCYYDSGFLLCDLAVRQKRFIDTLINKHSLRFFE